MFEKCPRILRECLTEREFKNFVDEFLIDIRATVIAMEDICPIAKKNTLGEKMYEKENKKSGLVNPSWCPMCPRVAKNPTIILQTFSRLLMHLQQVE